MRIYSSSRFIAAIMASTAITAPAIAGEVTGQVSDASETRYLQSANVRIVELNRSVSTDRDGRFVFADVPAGEYTLEISYSGAETVTQKVTVTETGRVVANASVGGADAREILVVGQAASFNSALSRQREADGVSSVLTRDSIGQFPDQNVAESLRRLPGVNILNDQGEGRFVSLRGLDPELNSSSLNGVRLPAPESDVRSVALDVLSSDSIESIEVKKSLTPDMDPDFIGGSIEISTTSAFDRKKDLLSVKVEGSYNDYADAVTPKGSIDFATKLGEDVGVSGGISYYKRTFETDNIETGGWDEAGNGVVFAEEVQYRDYDVTRERLSGSLNFDIRAGDFTNLYVRGTHSSFDDHEYRRRTTIISDGEPVSGSATSAVFTPSGSSTRIEVRRDHKDRIETQKITTMSLGGDHDDGVWMVKWDASYAKASEIENGNIDPIRVRARYNSGVTVAYDYSDERAPIYSLTNGAAAFNDVSRYSFNRIEYTDVSDSRDEEYAAKFDIARSFPMAGGEFTVQGGAKARWREKSYNFDLIYFDGFDGTFPVAGMLNGTQTYRITDMGPVFDFGAARAFFNQNRAAFEISQYDSDLESAIADYSVSEDILAGYLLGRYDSDTLRVIGGVRVEQTKNELNGFTTSDDGDTVTVAPNSQSREYTDWLPSLTVRFEPSEGLVLRFAGSKSLVRPKLSKMAPRYAINEDEEAEFGNPDLLPYEAWNLDAGVEFYTGTNGALSAGVFYKSIDNFIVDQYFDTPGTYRGVSYAEALIPVNGDTATVFGVELGVSQNLTFLPAPLDGFLIQANYSYTDTKGTVFTDGDASAPRDIPLPAASKHTGNIVIGYEKGPIELRAAGTYRSRYLDELGSDASGDRYVDNHFQIDLSAKFKVNDNLRLFAEWINVNDAKYFAYQNFGGAKRALQYEVYGPTVKFGAKLSF